MVGSRPFITPYIGKMSLAKVSDWLIEQGAQIKPKGDEVVRAYNMRLGDFSPQQLADYGAYCLTDTANCAVIADYLKERFPEDEADLLNYTVLKFLRSPLHLDPEVINRRLFVIKDEKQELLERVGMTDRKNLMSNALFAQTLEALGVEVPMKVSPTTGKSTYAFAKSDKDFQALAEHDNLEVQALVAARLGHKSTIEETRLERLLSIAEATGRRLPVSLLYYGAHTVFGIRQDEPSEPASRVRTSPGRYPSGAAQDRRR